MKNFSYSVALVLCALSISLRLNALDITTSVVWSVGNGQSNPTLQNTSIVVKNGGALELQVDVLFAQNTGITVEKGGLLKVNGVTLTSQSSSYMWEGIVIEGTNGTKVLPFENGMSNLNSPHGVVLINMGTITNAKIGVMVGNPNNNNTGGLLQALNTNFTNNGISILYSSFGPSTSENNKGNANYLRKCNFLADAPLNENFDGQNWPKAFIKLDQYEGGLTIRGCDFQTQNITMAVIFDKKIVGVHCTGGSSVILLDEADTRTVNGQTDAGRRNTFTALYKGVFFDSNIAEGNYESLQADFRNADFYKVMICFHFVKSGNMNVDCSNQSVDFNNYIDNACKGTYQEYEEGQGVQIQTKKFTRNFASCFVWLEECREYNIRNNNVNFESSFYEWGTGIYAINSAQLGSPACLISNNTFRFNGNEQNTCNAHGCYFVGANVESKLTCNIYINLYRDWSLKGLIFDKQLGPAGAYRAVLSAQGNSTNHANNTFSDNSLAPGKLNIEADASLTYYHYGPATTPNRKYPYWRLFNISSWASFTGIQNMADVPICNPTLCAPFIDKKVSELLKTDKANQEMMFNIFPNPNPGEFSITFDDNIRVGSVKVYDMVGRLIANLPVEKFIGTNTINIDGLSNGLYNLVINYNDNKEFNNKITISK